MTTQPRMDPVTAHHILNPRSSDLYIRRAAAQGDVYGPIAVFVQRFGPNGPVWTKEPGSESQYGLIDTVRRQHSVEPEEVPGIPDYVFIKLASGGAKVVRQKVASA